MYFALKIEDYDKLIRTSLNKGNPEGLQAIKNLIKWNQKINDADSDDEDGIKIK